MNMIKDTQIFHIIRNKMNFFGTGNDNEKNISEDSPVLINTPALLGKRDAMYEKAINILSSSDFFSMEPAERNFKYQQALSWLMTGITTSQQIAYCRDYHNLNKGNDGPMNQYMLLLADTVQAVHTLCNHQIIFIAEKEKISEFVGKKATTQIQKEDIVFAESEKKIFECALKLIEAAKTAIKTYQVNLKKSMSKDDEGRYKKAFMEYIGNSQ